MKVAVLGAGIAGITTAYELHASGHEVVIVEREEEAAKFTSYANAGLFAPGHAYAWSSPAAPGILLRSLWRNDQALRLGFSLSPRFWRWMWRFWGQCTSEHARLNTQRKVRLCLYSQRVFHDTLAATDIAYDGRKGGLLYLYRSPAAFAAAADKARLLMDEGCEISIVEGDAVVGLDPALKRVGGKICGALHATGDESGDCRKFALGLARWLGERGVEERYSTTITGVDEAGGKVRAIKTDRGAIAADAYVCCLGVYAPHFAARLGVDLPIYPVKGYSLTAPVVEPAAQPALGGVDEENLVAYCPLGARLRVTATAQFSGYSTRHRPADFRHMRKIAGELFGSSCDFERAEHWAGLRPMTPDGAPRLGRGRHENVWYNVGLGHMGWTMSHATARIVADLINCGKSDFCLEGMAL